MKLPYKYTKSLINAGIELIECGYISKKNGKSKNSTKFSSVDNINELLKKYSLNKCKSNFVIMINYFMKI